MPARFPLNLAHLPASTQLIVKRMLRVFVPTVLAILVGAFFIHQTEVNRQHADLASKEQETVRAGTVAINRTLQQVGRDLLYLSGRFQSRHVIDASTGELINRVSADWVTFSQANQVYNKLRWIDETGMEKMRIDYAEPVPQVVPKDKLQFKGKRYFFIETNSLKQNEIFVSPLDLNVDNKMIEVPHHPNIRFGMPMFDSRGNKRGILLINYSARNLLKRFDIETAAKSHRQWLVDQNGYWLKGPSHEDEYGFMFKRDDLTMGKRYPAAWKRILSAEKGQFESEEGLWTFTTVYPLQDWRKLGKQENSEVSMVTARVSENSRYAWKAVSLLPAESYNAGLWRFRLALGISVLVLLLLFFAISGRLIYVSAMRERIQSELNVATDIQASLLPRIFPPFPHRNDIDIYASMDPAKEVGGDFYDFFLIDDTHLCFLVADVSDKGVPAALYMMVAKTLLKSEGQRLADPARMLASVNNVLATDNDTCMFTTVLCAILNTQTGEVHLANAGHNPPLLITANEVRYLQLKAGLVLGAMTDVPYQNESLVLQKGDTLFFYTDGVTEAHSPENQLYGEARLLSTMQTCPKQNPTETIHCIRADVSRHAHGAPQSDDVTMLAITYRGESQAIEPKNQEA